MQTGESFVDIVCRRASEIARELQDKFDVAWTNALPVLATRV
jgi:hypothetical protein